MNLAGSSSELHSEADNCEAGIPFSDNIKIAPSNFILQVDAACWPHNLEDV